jgi:hypothetical protein
MGAEWTRFPIARLHYTKAAKRRSLYWRDRNLRFHPRSGGTSAARGRHFGHRLRRIQNGWPRLLLPGHASRGHRHPRR